MLKKKLKPFEFRYYLSPALLVIMFIVAVIMNGNHDIKSVLFLMIKEGTPYALIAIASGLVISTNNIDLSVTGVVTFASLLFALLSHYIASESLSIILVILVTTIIGTILGWIIQKTSSSSLILSWSMGALLLILCPYVSENKKLFPDITREVSFFPSNFRFSGLWGIGVKGIMLSLLIIIIIYMMIKFSNIIQMSCAIGGNQDSAVYCGVKVKTVISAVYGISGLLSGIAGIYLCLLGSGCTATGNIGLELTAIAMAVIGGTIMSGGYFAYFPVVCAAYMWSISKSTLISSDMFSDVYLQQRGIDALFAVFLILIAFISGKSHESSLNKLYEIKKAED